MRAVINIKIKKSFNKHFLILKKIFQNYKLFNIGISFINKPKCWLYQVLYKKLDQIHSILS